MHTYPSFNSLSSSSDGIQYHRRMSEKYLERESCMALSLSIYLSFSLSVSHLSPGPASVSSFGFHPDEVGNE
jgi:hypothetical protein